MFIAISKKVITDPLGLLTGVIQVFTGVRGAGMYTPGPSEVGAPKYGY